MLGSQGQSGAGTLSWPEPLSGPLSTLDGLEPLGLGDAGQLSGLSV